MSDKQIASKLIYDLCTLSFEEFLNCATDEQLAVLRKISTIHNRSRESKSEYNRFDYPPLYIYSYLLNERILSTPESKLNKRIKMFSALYDDKNEFPLQKALRGVLFHPTFRPSEIESDLLYHTMEWLTYELPYSIHFQIGEIPESSCVEAVQAFFLGFIRQLEPDEYTVEDGVYTVLNIEKSVDRLLETLDFDMCLLDIYSILLLKHYVNPFLCNQEAIKRLFDTVFKVPIKEIPLYSREKQSYFEFNEE